MTFRNLRHRSGLFFAVLLAIAALGAALRLPHVTARSLWFDEAFSWRFAHIPFTELFSRAAADVHPTFYYLLLRLWVLPWNLFSALEPLWWLRGFSVVFAIGTIVLLGIVGRSLFRSTGVGLFAALLVAFNAFQIQYAWEARMYTLGTFLTVLTLGCAIWATRVRDRRDALRLGLVFGIALACLLHTHYYTLFLGLAITVFMSGFILLSFMRLGRTAWRSPPVLASGGGVLLGVLLFLPWLPTFFLQQQRVSMDFWIPPLEKWSIPNTMVRLFLAGSEKPTHALAATVSIAAVTICIAALWRGRTKADLLLVLSVVTSFAGSWWISHLTSIYQDRYFVFAAIPLALLTARVLMFFPRILAGIFLAALLAIELWSTAGFWKALNFPAHPGARAAAEALLVQSRPGDTILVSSPFVYFPLSFHLRCPALPGPCANGLHVALAPMKEALEHYAGAPLLFPEDLATPNVLSGLTQRQSPFWVVDTTGFGGSVFVPPPEFSLAEESRFSELFWYQGDVIVRRYVVTDRSEEGI